MQPWNQPVVRKKLPSNAIFAEQVVVATRTHKSEFASVDRVPPIPANFQLAAE